MIAFITTMAQVNRRRKEGAKLYCSAPGYKQARVKDVRYSQGAFQVKVAVSDRWITPARLWAETKEPGEQAGPGLWDTVR